MNTTKAQNLRKCRRLLRIVRTRANRQKCYHQRRRVYVLKRFHVERKRANTGAWVNMVVCH